MAESWSFFLSNEEEEEKKNLVSILPCSYSLVLRSPPCWSSAACLSGSFSPQRTPSCRCTSPPFGQLRDSSTTFPFLFSLSRQTHAQTRRTTAERDINIRGFSYGYTYEYEFEILFFFFFSVSLYCFSITRIIVDIIDIFGSLFVLQLRYVSIRLTYDECVLVILVEYLFHSSSSFLRLYYADISG